MTRQGNRNSWGRRVTGVLKWLVPTAVVLGLVVLAFVPKPVVVDVGEITVGPMLLTIDENGETRVRERYTISAPLAGRVQRIGVDPGDEVREGDILVAISSVDPNLLDPRARARALALVGAAAAAVTGAETQHEARKVDAARLEKSYQRNKTLIEKGIVAAAVFEQAESAYLAAKHAVGTAASAVDRARFELEQARAALLQTEPGSDGESASTQRSLLIRSPIDGQVLRVNEESSRIVRPGEPLLEVGDPGDLEIRVDVLSQDAVKILPGQRVMIEHWGGEPELTGSVRLVEPSAFTKVSALGVDEQRSNVIVDFDASQQGAAKLGDGYRVEARIVVWEATGIVRVPAGALFRSGDQWAVYAVAGDRAELREIEINRNNGDVAEVLSGINGGDRVILHPSDRIEDGSLIESRK